MFKKIVLAVALIALPVLGAMAQQKFAHVNPQAIIVEMAEYKKAVADIETMQKNYQDELQRTEEEFNKKYQELVAQQDSLPRNILERRQKEVQDMYQRQQQFQQDPGFIHVGLASGTPCAQDMHPDLLAGIAAEHAAALDERGFRAGTGAGQCGTDARHAAADHSNVEFCLPGSNHDASPFRFALSFCDAARYDRPKTGHGARRRHGAS